MGDAGHDRSPEAIRVVTTDRGDAGQRLDLVLRRHLTDVATATRTRVQRWIEEGRVSVNGLAMRRAAARAARGDVVTVRLPLRAPPRVMAAENIRLDVLYEDDHLLAIDKPAGMVAHPTRAHPHGTLMNALLERARHWSAPQRPSLVGRLDKLTSGIVLVARTAAMHATLQRAMRRTDCEKDYLAVVYGRVGTRLRTIDLPIADDGTARRKVAARGAAGMPCITHIERLAHVAAPRAGLAVLRCRLVTGRTHQIRVHLSAVGWPIIGDPIYGEPRWSRIDNPGLAAALSAFPRQALHAWRVSLTHPVTGERLRLNATIPADITTLLSVAGLPAAFPF